MRMIASNIRELRKKLGYTQEQIAEYLDVSAAAITQYETGTRVVPAKAVTKLAILFNVDEYELYQEEPQQQQLLSAFAFRADELQAKDLKTISEFKKIVLNYFHLSKALKDE
jgi:transcriptional regulator with XRE-family HTH domain